MKYIEKLKTYKEIKEVVNKGEKIILKSSVLYKTPNQENSKKIILGILTSRKFGNSVKRNLAKRRILAALTLLNQVVEKNYIYVFIPRSKILTQNFPDFMAEISEKICKAKNL